MSTRTATDVSPPVEPAEVRLALDRVLASRHFVNAHKKKAFLRLICDLYLEGRAHEVNEYRLGFEVFGRESSYSPSADPIVRVVAHEIRKKLELYYLNEGADDPVRLELPAGSYQPLFTRHCQEPPPAPEPEPEAAPEAEAPGPEPAAAPEPARALDAPAPRAFGPATLWLGAAVLALSVAVVVLAISRRDLERRAVASSAAPPVLSGPLWRPFTRDDTPPLVVLSNPPVLRLANASDPDAANADSVPLAPETVAAMRDRFIINPEVLVRQRPDASAKGEPSPGPAPIVRQSRDPRLVYSRNVYTGMGEAIGLHRLTDYFRLAGRGIVLKQSRTVSAEDLKNHNMILLGGAWVNEWSGKLTEAEDFVFTSAGTVANRRVRTGEAAEYIPEFDGTTGEIAVDYAVVTVTATLTQAGTEMILAGVYSQGTEAAAEYVTDRGYVEQLESRLASLGADDSRPLHFQALLKVRVENGIPATISLVALHRLGEE